MKMFEVGGCVRDEILGVPSKDIDFTVVLEDGDFDLSGSADPFNVMVQILTHKGFKIFLKTREHLTVRAQFPGVLTDMGIYPPFPYTDSHLTADFVLARKEGTYSDGRRPDSVEVGTLADDLARRDFTMNAIAKDADGYFIDLFDGVADIHAGLIRAVGDPVTRLSEDALRAVRALRFSVTKGFDIDSALYSAMQSGPVLDAIEDKISDERISDELSKMFRFDTVASLTALSGMPLLTDAMFSGRVSLDSTLKTKGRGK